MTGLHRWVGLPVAAVLLVCGVVGVQLANGGGEYEPLRPADPCAARTVTSQAQGIDALTERLVLLGIDGAACRLHVSREAFTLELAQTDDPTDAQIDALRGGLKSAVMRMKADGTLPPASALVDESLDSTDLNDLVKRLIRALPDSSIDAALKTDDVLTRAVDDLDLRTVLANLDDQDALEQQIEVAVTGAVKASLEARIRDLV
ncbi:hypothetical protein [Aeromicrobium ginsengisoli]|uniref:Uncharacterized protein n=1 Tax=Aeromicrobium ginsengisoli TaxID=363867 RepID=A0A5M4FC89_9ACTN|nr:hypothetical protein [Aeromicrobium ginsengisoli]KAA1395512.1 hypothetical protein ESP70_015250 [Aeromicrobium ginsengisoli]